MNSARQPSGFRLTDTSHTASHPSSELLSLNQYVSCFTPAGLTANSNALRLSWNESIITRTQSDGDPSSRRVLWPTIFAGSGSIAVMAI